MSSHLSTLLDRVKVPVRMLMSKKPSRPASSAASSASGGVNWENEPKLKLSRNKQLDKEGHEVRRELEKVAPEQQDAAEYVSLECSSSCCYNSP